MGIASALAKLLSALLDIPGWWQRWREHRKDVKIQKLEVEIERKDATVVAENLHQEYAETHEKNRKKIEDEATTKDLDSIIDYFGNP